MPKLDILNMSGQSVGAVELSEEVFGIEPNVPVMHAIVKNILANRRQGTQMALTRAGVKGGGRKPYRQKGTDRARQGSITAPNHVGGGIVFAPQPRSYRYSLPKKVRRLGMKSAFSAKVKTGNMVVVEELKLDSPSTKDMAQIIGNLGASGKKVLVVTAQPDRTVVNSTRNIKGAKATFVGEVNVYDILNHDVFLATKGAVDRIEEVYGK